MTTLLVYLGYLTFDFDTKEIWMLDATLQRNEKAVEEIIDKIY